MLVIYSIIIILVSIFLFKKYLTNKPNKDDSTEQKISSVKKGKGTKHPTN